MSEFSDFIVYVDESGDHSLEMINEIHPVFVLAFCIFKKSDYIEKIIPSVCSLKFDFWGHDSIVFHSHKIRKQADEFSILANLPTLERFMARISDLIDKAPFKIVSTLVDKNRLKDRYTSPHNPYHLGLLFCLERTTRFLQENGQAALLTHIIVETRGRKEDTELELEFQRIMTSADAKKIANFKIQFADKRVNSTGLQIADLIAHPIGRHYINPSQKNRSFNNLETKFYKYPNYEGKGLKVFPKA